MGAPGIHVSPRLLAGSIAPGNPITVIGSPTIGVYRAGIPQIVLDPNDGDSIDVRIVRGNGDLTRPSNVPWSVAGVGPNPLLRTDFVGGQFPSGVAPFAAGDTEFLVQLNFAAGQPPAVARTGVLALGTPDWGTLDLARPQGDLLLPHVLPPDEDLSSWQTAWVDPATDVPSVWVLWGGTAAGAVVGYSGGALRVYPGPDPTAATQRVVLWSRTPLPGTDWRVSFTYARADTAAPSPLAAVATTFLLGCAGVGAYPAGILTYVGADTTTPTRAHLLANLNGLLLDIDELHGPDDGRHVLYDLPAPLTPGGGRITPPSDRDFVFTPPTLYDVAIEKVGGALTVKWRPQGGAWEDYTVAVGVHAGLQWGLLVVPNRDASFSGLTVSSYLGDASRLLPFDPTPRYDDYLDTPPVAAVETRTVSTVAQLVSAHDTIAPNGHIVVADGVILSTDFDLARSLPPGTRVVVRAHSPQGATLACNVRILGDGWELRDLKEAPRASAAARIRVIDADHVRVSRINCTGQTGAFAVVTVEGDRPCSDIRIDRLTVQGHTTWGIAILATADKNVQLDWNEIPGSLLTTVGGGVLVGADSQANGLVLVKVAAFNRIGAIRAPHAFLVRASRGVYFRNSLNRGSTGCDLAVDNGTDNFYVSNDLTGGARLLVRGLVPVVLGNKSRGVGSANPACVLFAGNYDPVSDGFEPGFPTQAQLQALTGVVGIQPREACSGALLASNDFEGLISVGANSVADAVRPVPVRGTTVFDHTGDGLVSAGATWDVGTQYRPAAARPAGITAPSTFPLAAGDAGISQDDSILNVIIIINPGHGDPVAPWWKLPGGNRSGKLWNRGPGLTFSTSAWTPTMGPYDVTTGASHRNQTTMNEVIGGPVSANLADYDNVAKIQGGSQLDWPGTTMDSAAKAAVPGKTWLIWVPDTNPTGGPYDTNGAVNTTVWSTWAAPGVHDDWWYAMGRRARAVMLSYGLAPWQLMLRINHEMVQSNNYQIFYGNGPDYAKAMGRFMTGFRAGYTAHSADDYPRMIFSPSRHEDCGPLERFFTCDPVALTTPYDLVDVSAHPAGSMNKYATGFTLAQQVDQVNIWINGGNDNNPSKRASDLPTAFTTTNYAQNCTVADHSMIKLAKKYRIGMCNSEWSPRYDGTLFCTISAAVHQAMHNWFTANAAWYAFECVFHSNTLNKTVGVANWAAGVDMFINLWTADPAEVNKAAAGTNPGATHTGQLTLGGGGGPNRSGLSWPSGMCDDSSLAGMMTQLHAWETARARLCDVSTQFFGRQHTSWTQLTDNFLLKPSGLVASLIAEGITPALTIAHFSSAMPGLSVAAAARGDYDAYHLAAAQRIAALGVPVIIRLGHECDDDGNVYSYYHSGVTVADYKAMFRRQSLIYKGAIGPDCRIEWNHLRQAGQASGHDDDPDTFYPGNDVVDIIGADCYGNSPRGNPSAYIVTDADWLAYLNNISPNGHPQGPGTWLAYAVSKGKQFGVAEWGVTNWMGPGTVADSARYIRGMYEFFRDNAANIAYESYFNRIAGTATAAGGHKLLPAVDNPNASAQYMTSWAQTLAGSSFTFGADYSVNYNVKKGNVSQSLISQPASDTVVLTAGADNTKQAALYLLCKQRPAVNNGTWSFYYKRLDANVHTDTLGIGTHFIVSYVGSGGAIPANPSTWATTIYRPVSGEPCGDSILAQDGDGLRIGFDEANEPSPNLSNVLDAVAYQRSLTRPALGLAARQVNLANLAPGVEWLVTVVLSGQTIDFRATCPGHPAIHVIFNDPLIAAKAGGWFGFRLDRGRSCQLRALTYLPG